MIKYLYILAVILLLLLPRLTLANVDCSYPGRMNAAQLHYKSGCYVAAIGICSQMNFINRPQCYRINQAKCELSGDNYKKWLEQK